MVARATLAEAAKEAPATAPAAPKKATGQRGQLLDQWPASGDAARETRTERRSALGACHSLPKASRASLGIPRASRARWPRFR